MIIETIEKIDKEFAIEQTNVVFYTKRYIKNPKEKYKDWKSFSFYGMIIVFWIAVIVNVIWDTYIKTKGISYDIMKTIIGAILFFFIFIWLFCCMLYKRNLGKEMKVKYTFNEERIDCDIIGDKSVAIYWNSMSCIKAFNNTFCFIPKETSGFIIFMEMKYFNQVKQFVKENNINVNIVE